MTATRFEARFMSWLVLGIYAVAFCGWPLDRRDVAGFLTKMFPMTAVGTGFGYLIAAALAGAGSALTTWTMAYPQPTASGAGALIQQGSYRYVRHQRFIGIWLCCFAFGLLLNGVGLTIIAFSTAALFHRLIRREEIRTAVMHPSSYQPNVKPAWLRGLAAGCHLWLATAALTALGFTLSEKIFLGILGASASARLMVGLSFRS